MLQLLRGGQHTAKALCLSDVAKSLLPLATEFPLVLTVIVYHYSSRVMEFELQSHLDSNGPLFLMRLLS